jgi:hypothetical protein
MTHPIIPSADLILQWRTQWQNDNEEIEITNLIYQAARWGGDQELEACCNWLEQNQSTDPEETVEKLYEERRGDGLTVKEQALQALEVLVEEGLDKKSYDVLLDALESLPD